MLIFGMKTVGFLSLSFIVELPKITIDLAISPVLPARYFNPVHYINHKLTHSSGTSPAADPLICDSVTGTNTFNDLSDMCHPH